MFKGIMNGAYLVEIMGADYRYYNYSGGIALDIKVSNLEVKQKKININIFDDAFNTSTESFTEFIGTNVESQMIGKLFYCYLEKNSRGYFEIKKLYMPIDRSKLFFDPRNSKLLVKHTVKRAYKGMI